MREILFDNFKKTLKEVNFLEATLEKKSVSKKELQKGIIKANLLLFSNHSYLSIFAETIKSEVSSGYKIKALSLGAGVKNKIPVIGKETRGKGRVSVIEIKIIYNELLNIIDSEIGKQIIQPKEFIGVISNTESLNIYMRQALIKGELHEINSHSELNELSILELSETYKKHIKVIKRYLEDILLYEVFFIFAKLDLDCSEAVVFARDLNKEYIDSWINCSVSISNYEHHKSIDHWVEIFKLNLDNQTIEKIKEYQKKLFDEELDKKLSLELKCISKLQENEKKIIIENYVILIEEFFKGNFTKTSIERLKNILLFSNSRKVLVAFDNLKKNLISPYKYIIFGRLKPGYSPVFTAFFFIKYLEILKNSFGLLEIESVSNSNKNAKLSYIKKSRHQSFTYINNHTKQTHLTDLMNALKRKNFIIQSTDLKDFRKIFSGEAVGKQIIWTGTISELSYFIKQLHNVLKLVVNIKQDHWVVTINCFIQKNGEQYNRKKLRTQKVPTTSKSIDSALDSLK